MTQWEIQFYPAKGERNSPVDDLFRLCNQEERSKFQQKLRLLGELEVTAWQFSWLKKVQGLYQIRQGDFRGYFQLNQRKIIIVHFCRKVKQQAKESDLSIASANWKSYLEG